MKYGSVNKYNVKGIKHSTMSNQIVQFYKNETIFITGGTGFLGKVLIEKLIRVCEPKKIFVLVRPKKGKTTEERVDDFFSFPCFDRIKQEKKNFKGAIHFLSGDCASIDLGLAKEDVKVLVKETTIVIHAAANVKFDQTLREAANNNVRSTVSTLTLAKKMPLLKAFVFVSTAYSNCIHEEIKEEFYPPPMTHQQLFAILDGLDDGIVKNITPKLLGKWPNTYIYTKSVAENAVETLGKDLPITIVRPAIVVNAAEEPAPGWIDNFYGLAGIIIGVVLGVIRTLHAKPDCPAYIVPVDYVSNLVLTAACNIHKEKQTTIYNYIGHRNNILTWSEVMKAVEPHCWDAATDKVLWYYCFKMRENKLWNDICVFFLHTMVAYLVDFVLLCVGRPRIAVENYRRLNKQLDLISYFTVRRWKICDDNVMKLLNEMDDEDRKLFNFDMENLDNDDYCRKSIFGGRLYLLKDTLDTIPKGNRKLKILFVAHYTLLALFWLLVFKFVMFLYRLVF